MRITRSVSRQMREKSGSDYERTTENSRGAVDLFKFSESESRNRRASCSASLVRGTSFDMGNDKTVSPRVQGMRRCQLSVNPENDDKVGEGQQIVANLKRIIVLGLCVQMVERQSTHTSSRLLVRKEESSIVKQKKSENFGLSNNHLGNHSESQKRVTRSSGAASSLNHEKGVKSDDFRQVLGNSERVVTRSASNPWQGKSDVCGQMTERQRSRTSSRVLARKAEFPQVKEKLKDHQQKRMTRSSGASFSVIHEKDDKADGCQQIVGNSNRMVTRSASKALREKTDLSGHMLERRSSSASSRVLTRKAESLKEKKEKLENNNVVKCSGNQYRSQKRMTCSSGAPSSIDSEKDDEKDECPPNVGNMLVTRSAFKAMQQKTNLIGQMVEKWSSRTSSRLSERKAESPKAKKQKLENSVLSDSPGNQPKKRITRRLDSELDKVGCDLISPCSSSGGAAVKKSRDETGEEPKLIGFERIRGKTRIRGTNQGWTKDQEMSLQNAYFTAKPSPHFWKKVAKLVPGKTAQQCFDKMNSNIQTPPSTQPLSRVRKGDSPSVLSFSGGKLFKSTEKKSKKTRKAKQKSHISHRNVRHLLKKYSRVNQDSEADLFSVLEPTVNPSTEPFLSNSEKMTQKHKLVSVQNNNSPSNRSFSESEFNSAGKKSKKTGRGKQKSHVTSTNVRNLLRKSGHVGQDNESDLFSVLEPAGEAYQYNLSLATPMNKLVSPGSSSLNHKKRLSRFSGVSATPLTSPPVLKKVKNLALHEKYIDQLHMREAKRKVASARYLKATRPRKNEDENHVAAKDVIKTAKVALCSDAKDVIHKFQQSQADLMGECSDSEERFCSDEDDVEETMS